MDPAGNEFEGVSTAELLTCFGVQLGDGPEDGGEAGEFSRADQLEADVLRTASKLGRNPLARRPKEGSLYEIGGSELRWPEISSWAYECAARIPTVDIAKPRFSEALVRLGAFAEDEKHRKYLPSDVEMRGTRTALVSFERVVGFAQALDQVLRDRNVEVTSVPVHSFGYYKTNSRQYVWDFHVIFRVESKDSSPLDGGLLRWLLVAHTAWLCQESTGLRVSGSDAGSRVLLFDPTKQDKPMKRSMPVWRQKPESVPPTPQIVYLESYEEQQLSVRSRHQSSRSRLNGLFQHLWTLSFNDGLSVELQFPNKTVLLAFTSWRPSGRESILEDRLLELLMHQAIGNHASIVSAIPDPELLLPTLFDGVADLLPSAEERIAPSLRRSVRVSVLTHLHGLLEPETLPGCHCAACFNLPDRDGNACPPLSDGRVGLKIIPTESYSLKIEPKCSCGTELCDGYYLPAAPVAHDGPSDRVREWVKSRWLKVHSR